MNIEEKINEVMSYFEDKVISGNFEFINADEHTATIKINGYQLSLWIANTPDVSFRFYDISFWPFEKDAVTAFKTREKKRAGYKAIKPYIDKYQKEAIQKQINELKKKL